MKKKIVLKWSRKDDSWLFNYPDLNGKMLMGDFFEMVTKTMDKDYMKRKLTEAGYDYTSFKITCNKIGE